MASSTTQLGVPLYPLLEKAFKHVEQSKHALSSNKREHLSQLLANASWLQIVLDAFSDSIHVQLQGMFPQMGNHLCAKGELQSALHALLQNDYEGFEHHLAFAQQWYEWDGEDTPQEPIRYI